MHNLLLLAILMLPATAQACVCEAPTESPREVVAQKFASSDVVAILEVVDNSAFTATFANTPRRGRWVVLESRYVFKGSVVAGQRFYAEVPGLLIRSDCDVRLKKRQLVLAYALSQGPVRISFCSPSGELVSRLTDLQFLFQLAGRS